MSCATWASPPVRPRAEAASDTSVWTSRPRSTLSAGADPKVRLWTAPRSRALRARSACRGSALSCRPARVDRRLRWHDVYSQGRDEGFNPWRSAEGRGKRPGLVRPGEQWSLAHKWVRESYVPCNSYKLVCLVYRSFELENANVPLRTPNRWTKA